MRFSLRIHFPFICSSKSSRRLQTPPTCLKFEDARQVSSSPSPVSIVDDKVEGEKDSKDNGNVRVSPKSILKKVRITGSETVEKGKVKWVDDCAGKELVEIREFEPIECGESMDHDDRKRSYACLVL